MSEIKAPEMISKAHSDLTLEISGLKKDIEYFSNKLKDVAVSLEKVLTKLDEMIDKNDSLKTKVDGFTETARRLNQENIDTNKRLKFLEKAYWIGVGVLTAVSVLSNLPKVTDLFK